jgi:hypothetical protein
VSDAEDLVAELHELRRTAREAAAELERLIAVEQKYEDLKAEVAEREENESRSYGSTGRRIR